MPADNSENPTLHSTIVIHPGSLYLRIGRASDPHPHQLLHAVARHRRPGGGVQSDPFIPPMMSSIAANAGDIDACRQQIATILQTSLQSDGRRRHATTASQVAASNRRSVSRPLVDEPARDAYTPTADREVIFSDEILQVNPAELAASFNVHFPMRRGELNLHAGVGGSLQAVLADMQHIWLHALDQQLGISGSRQLAACRAVLVVPDCYNRWHLRELMTLLLRGCGFGAAFFVQDHVCATFGAGMPYACVVDCGDQKTSVSCVEDGISHAGTRVRLEYGAADVAQVHRWLLRRCGWPAMWQRVDERRPAGAMWVRDVMRDCCHVDLDRCGPQERRLRVRGEGPGEPTEEWRLQTGDEAMVAPLALFYTELLAVTEEAEDGGRSVWLQKAAAQQPEAEDCFDAEYLRETGRKYTREQLDQSGPLDPASACAPPATPTRPAAISECLDEIVVDGGGIDVIEREHNGKMGRDAIADQRDFRSASGQIIGLDQAVLKSIERCGSDELKRKMYGAVLVVGGGMRFAGAARWLQARLALQTPYQFAAGGGGGGGEATAGHQQQEVVTMGAKDGEAPGTVWRGAAIMAGLESAPELFIEAGEWEKWGVRILRERAPFVW